MPKPDQEKAAHKAAKTDKPAETEAETTLPPESSIVSEEPFTSPSGQQYRIIHTNETDASDTPPAKGKRRRTSNKAKK